MQAQENNRLILLESLLQRVTTLFTYCLKHTTPTAEHALKKNTMRKNDFEKHEQFKNLYLSRSYNLSMIATKLGVSRNTVYNWKRQMYPKDDENKFNRKMFTKLYESGLFSIEDITKLLRIHPASVKRFIRNHEKYRAGEKRCNLLNNSVIWVAAVRYAFEWYN